MASYRVLYHHGIKGQKWGVRRYQNEDGTRTEEGKKRESKGMSDKTKKTLKNVAKGVAVGAGLAVAGYGAYKMRDIVKTVPIEGLKDYQTAGAEKIKKVLKELPSKARNSIKESAKSAADGFKEGVKEGIHDAPKKLGKTLVMGTAMILGKKILDEVLGKDQTNKVFKAANPKKLYSFWNNVDSGGDKKEDDD